MTADDSNFPEDQLMKFV